MKTLIIFLILMVGNQGPVITDCRRTGKLTMGQLFDGWRQETKSREDNNFWWYVHRCEKGWDDPNNAPWYIRDRVKEYFN